MSGRIASALYVAAMVAVIVGADVAFFKDRFWERLMANIGIVLVFVAFYLRFLRAPEFLDLSLSHPLVPGSPHSPESSGEASRRTLLRGDGARRFPDHLEDGLRLGEHRDVARAQLDGDGVHPLGRGAFEIGMDCVILGRDDVVARL